MELILNDDQWVDDATGLVPHCLKILRTCHSLTERLANFAIRPQGIKGSPNRLIEAAKRIPNRVDDVSKYNRFLNLHSKMYFCLYFSNKYVSTT